MSDHLIETIARAIYDQFTYDEAGTKPKWVERGNSIKQGDARCYAQSVLTALSSAGIGTYNTETHVTVSREQLEEIKICLSCTFRDTGARNRRCIDAVTAMLAAEETE